MGIRERPIVANVRRKKAIGSGLIGLPRKEKKLRTKPQRLFPSTPTRALLATMRCGPVSRAGSIASTSPIERRACSVTTWCKVTNGGNGLSDFTLGKAELACLNLIAVLHQLTRKRPARGAHVMKVSEKFASNFLKAEDLRADRRPAATMEERT
jgi:hypothetical protein